MKKKKKSWKLLLPFLIIAAILITFHLFPKESKANSDALKNKLIPLKTVQAGNGFEDLQALKEILKDKQIVAMGEATHGTKEFFQMKHRMFEFLVEEMGYRVFAMEADFGECQAINNYILNGKGSATEAIKAMEMWVWDTKEVFDMVEWMRKYNENPNHKTKIKFYGFDMQSKLTYENKKIILNYVKKVDENIFEKFEDNLRNILVLDELNKDKKNIEELISILNENRENFISKTSKGEFEIIVQDLKNINQNIELKMQNKYSYATDSDNIRDKYMAENVKWILDYESQFGNNKIMIWAHNAHVSKKYAKLISMGEHLKELFNDKYYSIGFDFYDGTFRAIPLDINYKPLGNIENFTIQKSIEDSLSHIFQKTGIPLSFVDLKYASQDKNIKKLLSESQNFHDVGWGYNKELASYLYYKQIPAEAYDGLIFIKSTSASEGLN